jgi:TPR repeat protein
MAATGPTVPGRGVPTYLQIVLDHSLIPAVEEAAKKGDFIAQFRLARCYECGTGGVPKDQSQADFWNQRAKEIMQTQKISAFRVDAYCSIGPADSDSDGESSEDLELKMHGLDLKNSTQQDE